MSPTRVLYVDDERVNLKLFELTFRNDFQVLTAMSGEQGLKIIEDENQIDVVVSDVRMPGLDGLQFIEMVKKKWPNLPCMLLSGYVEFDELWEGHDKNMVFTYMMKPWKRDALYETIRSATGRA